MGPPPRAAGRGGARPRELGLSVRRGPRRRPRWLRAAVHIATHGGDDLAVWRAGRRRTRARASPGGSVELKSSAAALGGRALTC